MENKHVWLIIRISLNIIVQQKWCHSNFIVPQCVKFGLLSSEDDSLKEVHFYCAVRKASSRQLDEKMDHKSFNLGPWGFMNKP